MKLIITTGTVVVSAVLEQIIRECVPSVPALNRDWIKPHLYLTLAETFERLELDRTVREYALSDGSILHLMSAVR